MKRRTVDLEIHFYIIFGIKSIHIHNQQAQLRPGLFSYQIGSVLERDFYGLLGDFGQA